MKYKEEFDSLSEKDIKDTIDLLILDNIFKLSFESYYGDIKPLDDIKTPVFICKFNNEGSYFNKIKHSYIASKRLLLYKDKDNIKLSFIDRVDTIIHIEDAYVIIDNNTIKHREYYDNISKLYNNLCKQVELSDMYNQQKAIESTIERINDGM